MPLKFEKETIFLFFQLEEFLLIKLFQENTAREREMVTHMRWFFGGRQAKP